jgi:hypothetical protein
MAPLLTKKMYGERALFDPAPGTIHIKDLIQEESHYLDRTSDFVTGSLMLASHLGKISKVEACYFQVPFTIGVKLRTSTYKHEGHPFVGPDGGAMHIGDRVFGGSQGLAAGAYSLLNVSTAPNYDTWLASSLFRSTTEIDSDLHRAAQQAPKRRKDGTRTQASASTSSASALVAPCAPAIPSSSPTPSVQPSTPGTPARQRSAPNDAAEDSDDSDAPISVKRPPGQGTSTVTASEADPLGSWGFTIGISSKFIRYDPKAKLTPRSSIIVPCDRVLLASGCILAAGRCKVRPVDEVGDCCGLCKG